MYHRRRIAASLKAAGVVMGVLQKKPAAWFAGDKTVDAAQVEQLIAARNAARAAKNFAEADRLRKELADLGVTIEDRAGQTTWRIAG